MAIFKLSNAQATIFAAVIAAVTSLVGAVISGSKGLAAIDSAEKAEISAQKVEKLMPLGTIIASELGYSEFCLAIGDSPFWSTKNTWAPADGRGVQGSEYSRIRSNVPDLRGVFLRGLNNFYPNNAGAGDLNLLQLDPDPNRQPGKFQIDATRMPNESFLISKDGEHSHKFEGKTVNLGGDSHYGEYVDAGSNDLSAGKTYTPSGFVKRQNSAHDHTIQGGDAETRPKNVAIYYYVKIN